MPTELSTTPPSASTRNPELRLYHTDAGLLVLHPFTLLRPFFFYLCDSPFQARPLPFSRSVSRSRWQTFFMIFFIRFRFHFFFFSLYSSFFPINNAQIFTTSPLMRMMHFLWDSTSTHASDMRTSERPDKLRYTRYVQRCSTHTLVTVSMGASGENTQYRSARIKRHLGPVRKPVRLCECNASASNSKCTRHNLTFMAHFFFLLVFIFLFSLSLSPFRFYDSTVETQQQRLARKIY